MEIEDIEKRFARLDDSPVARALEKTPHSEVSMRRTGDALEVESHSWASPHRTTLLATGDGITIRDDFGPLYWTRHVPRESIERVTAEMFKFGYLTWHLAIHTTRKTIRVAWAMEEKTAHDVVVAMREVLQVP